MLRNGVNYKGLYGNSRTCFGVENKGHKLNKNSLPCLLDILPVFVYHIFAISVQFQWVLGSLNIFRALYPAIYIHKRLVTAVAIVFFEINCKANNASVSKSCRGQRSADHGLGIKEGLTYVYNRIADYGLRTGFKGELKSGNHIFLVFIFSKFKMYKIKFR